MSLPVIICRAWAAHRARLRNWRAARRRALAQDVALFRVEQARERARDEWAQRIDEPVPYLPTDCAWDCQIREASRQERMEAAMASVFDWTFSSEDHALLTAWMTGGAGLSPLHEPSAVERGWAL